MKEKIITALSIAMVYSVNKATEVLPMRYSIASVTQQTGHASFNIGVFQLSIYILIQPEQRVENGD